MSKFTPGPWVVKLFNRDISVQYQPSHVIAANGTKIVQFDTASCDATARLIAAAPELYAKLEEALDLVPRISDDDPIAPALADWCRAVRALLAKIEGEQ